MLKQEHTFETEIAAEAKQAPRSERELAPGVLLCQEEQAGQFVEIILPVFDMQQLIRECERDFPEYAIKLCQAAVERHSESITPETTFTPELIKGMLNTQILGTVLSRHPQRPDESIGVISDLEQAFGLAMKGHFRLTADPLSWSGDSNPNESTPPAPNLGPSADDGHR